MTIRAQQVPSVEEEEDNFDDKTTTPEIPLPLDIEEILPGEQDGVQPQLDDTQGENTQIPTFTIDDQGRRVSTRERRAPTDYIPDGTNVRYNTVEGTANASILDGPMRKFTEIDQLVHILGVTMIQTHGLEKGLKLFGKEGETCAPERNATAPRHGNYESVDHSKLMYKQKNEAVESLVNLVRKRTGNVKARQCGRGGYAENP